MTRAGPNNAAPSHGPRILGVNPWIHDFAAYDFWARPLGLLSLLGLVRSLGARVSYWDCLWSGGPVPPAGRRRLEAYGCRPYEKTALPLPPALSDVKRTWSRYGRSPDLFRQYLKSLPPPDAVFLTSVMTYWYPGVQEAVRLIKQQFPRVPVVLGGIYATLCPEHARAHSGADFVVEGPGEAALPRLLEDILGWLPAWPPDPDSLNGRPWPALDLSPNRLIAPVLTSLGCPFQCEYCASRILQPRFQRRRVDSVLEEMAHWREKYGIRDFAFYDDALLVNARDHALPLLEKIIRWVRPVRLHTPNAVHIRNCTRETADLLFRAGTKNLRLGLETMDFDHRQDEKLTREEFFRAVKNLKQAGFKKQNLGAYLLIGLPGQDWDAAARSARMVLEAGLSPAWAHYTPVPRTALWEAACKSSRYDLQIEPLCTNNSAFPCAKEPFSKDWQRWLRKMAQ